MLLAIHIAISLLAFHRRLAAASELDLQPGQDFGAGFRARPLPPVATAPVLADASARIRRHRATAARLQCRIDRKACLTLITSLLLRVVRTNRSCDPHR